MTIQELQLLLKKSGQLIELDGVIGIETIQAIRNFQKLHNIQISGKLTEETVIKLSSYSNVDISKMKDNTKPRKPVKKPVIIPVKDNPLQPVTDKPTLKNIEGLHPAIKNKVYEGVQIANSKLTGNAKVRIIQGFRTIAYQNELYAQGRTKPGKIITWAKGSQSVHNYGLAVDFALLVDNKAIPWDAIKDYDGDGVSDWIEVAQVFKSLGFLWGGDWVKKKDLPHLEWVHNWRPLLAKHDKKDFIPGTHFVNL